MLPPPFSLRQRHASILMPLKGRHCRHARLIDDTLSADAIRLIFYAEALFMPLLLPFQRQPPPPLRCLILLTPF
jgi:hypothetical protein